MVMTTTPLDYRQTCNISHTLVGSKTCWSLRCSSSSARQRCSNFILILNLTPGFNILHRNSCKTRWGTFEFCDLVHLILEIWQYHTNVDLLARNPETHPYDNWTKCPPFSTHWGQDKMVAIFQTLFSNAFPWMEMFEFWLEFHWSLFLKFQLTINQHWIR